MKAKKEETDTGAVLRGREGEARGRKAARGNVGRQYDRGLGLYGGGDRRGNCDGARQGGSMGATRIY